MSGNSGAWGVVMWKDGRENQQLGGISLEGGDGVLPFLPTTPLGCLVAPPDGMGVPPVRSGDVVFAQRDGVVQFGDYYESRILTFQIEVTNDACPGCARADQIDAALVLDGTAPGRAFAPDSPGLEITGDLEIEAHLALDTWPPLTEVAVMSQWLMVGVDERGWIARINSTGTLSLFWSEDGTVGTVQSATSSTSLPPMADDEPLWLRYSLDVDNGAGGHDVRFYTSTDGLVFTQLGTVVTQAGVTTVHNSTADVIVGSYDDGTSEELTGRVFSAEVRNDGVTVADPDFDQPEGTTSFVDDAGNTWAVVAPATLVPFSAAVLSARQKVSRLTEEWSRNCDGATLVILTDCHEADATQEEKVYLGPYLVHGRPRVAEVTWHRSDIGGASVLLRFDCEDARLRLLVNNDPDLTFPWSAQHTADAQAGGGGGNMLPDYRLDSLSMTLNGATVDDAHLSSGAPDGGSYFSRNMITVNTTSPMAMALVGSGTSGIPVSPGDVLSMGWWARKNNPSGGIPESRLDWTWYDAGGSIITNHNGTGHVALSEWQRFTEENIVAPALAAFAQFRLVWTGIPGTPGYSLDLAQAWLNEGATVTDPATVEVVGTLCVFPTITLFGDLTAPITVNYGPNTFVYNEDVANNVVIDTKWGRAATITVDTTQHLSGNYTSPLDPGIHDFSITTGDPADTGSARIEWSNAVVSG